MAESDAWAYGSLRSSGYLLCPVVGTGNSAGVLAWRKPGTWDNAGLRAWTARPTLPDSVIRRRVASTRCRPPRSRLQPPWALSSLVLLPGKLASVR